MLEYGIICDIDAARGYVKAYIPETNNTTEWCPMMRNFSLNNKQSLIIEINDLVLCGHTTHGNRWFVLGAAPSDASGPYAGATASKYGVKFADGTLLEYDLETSKLTVDAVGDVEISGAMKVEITSELEVDITATIIKISAASITLDGDVAIIGALSATAGMAISGPGGITAEGNISTSGEIAAGGVSLSSHIHTGVTSGLSTSGPPVPTPII